MSVNKAILIGRVGVNPELKNLEGGNKVVNFSLATSEYFKDKSGVKQEKTEWHYVVAWGSLAEVVANNITKGSQLYVEGKIQTRSWEDKEGNKKYTTEIVANNITFLSSKKNNDSEQTVQTENKNVVNTKTEKQSNTKAQQPNTKTQQQVVVANDDSDDDLPF